MTIQTFRRTLEAQPFLPFVMVLADGSRVRVVDPKFVWIVPSATRTVIVDQPHEPLRFLDLLLVAALEVEKLPLKKRGRTNGNGRG